MNQIALSFDEPIIEEPKPKPVDSFNQTETSMPWRAFVGGRWTPYEEPKEPTDTVRLTFRCPHCRAGCGVTEPLAHLDPDMMYCIELGDAWSPKDQLPCWTCARRVGEFLIKLIVP
ncbi:hypothetical protein [Spirosoma validum]|uniref:Uncharacterized protein n=1 Tax=Spirosoma validum TaxID=2771355 RepID=A0A927B1B4_9BACT|nr:hypothetical protein [Spirosoma validum]MBD2753724.1 hypothetical protein [Spirosoma validum]